MRTALRLTTVGILTVSCTGDLFPTAPEVPDDPYVCVPGNPQTRDERYPSSSLRLVVGGADVARAYRVTWDNCNYQESGIEGLVVAARDSSVVAVTEDTVGYGFGSYLVEGTRPGGTWLVFEAPDLLDSIPIEVPDTFAVGEVSSVAAGGAASCATTSAGDRFCWGGVWHPAIGSSDMDPRVGSCFGAPCTPMPMPAPGSDAGALTMSRDAACSLDAAGSVRCSGTLESFGDPQGTFTTIAVGSSHACGLDPDGAAHCWGSNHLGELGRGDRVEAPGAAPVVGDRTWRSISVVDATTCGVTQDGRLYCWGWLPSTQSGAVLCDSYSGKGGTTETYCSASPVSVRVLSPTDYDTIPALVSGRCLLTTEGAPACTERGELAFDRIAGAPRFVSLSAGDGHRCGLTADGSAYCWGENAQGQLGDGTRMGRSTPQAVGGGHRFTQLAVGDAHTCGLVDGAVWCWGANDAGQAGGSIIEWPRTPRRVPGQGGP